MQKKKTKKATRIESDDEGAVNGADNDVADIYSDDSTRKCSRGTAGKKRKSFVEDSEDSDDEAGR